MHFHFVQYIMHVLFPFIVMLKYYQEIKLVTRNRSRIKCIIKMPLKFKGRRRTIEPVFHLVVDIAHYSQHRIDEDICIY